MHGQNINLPLCVCLSVCSSHFLSNRLQVRPLNEFFLQLIALTTRTYAKMCLLGVSIMNNHVYGSKVLQNRHSRGMNRHFKPNAKNSNSYIFRSVYQIDIKFDRRLRPATETSWVVSYGGKTIPRWRTDAILEIDISPYLSEKSSDFDEILCSRF